MRSWLARLRLQRPGTHAYLYASESASSFPIFQRRGDTSRVHIYTHSAVSGGLTGWFAAVASVHIHMHGLINLDGHPRPYILIRITRQVSF